MSVPKRDDEKRIALRLPTEVHQQLVQLAERERRSINAQIIRLIEQADHVSRAYHTMVGREESEPL